MAKKGTTLLLSEPTLEMHRPEWYLRVMRVTAFVLCNFLLSLALGSAQTSGDAAPRLWPDAEKIEHFLKKGKIVERQKIGTGVTNPEKVKLELEGEVLYAVLKKVDTKYDNWRYEVGAYELDKLFGLGMIPPTVARSVRGRKGCLQLWVTGETMEAFEGDIPDVDDWRAQVSTMWLFDDIIANVDRHLNNAIVSPGHRLILIDNSKTFRNRRGLINDLNGPGTGTHARFWRVEYDPDRKRYPTVYPAEVIERFRRPTDKELKKAIGRFVWGFERDLVVKRRQMILERLDAMLQGEPPG